jgi:hypothetical protein
LKLSNKTSHALAKSSLFPTLLNADLFLINSVIFSGTAQILPEAKNAKDIRGYSWLSRIEDNELYHSSGLIVVHLVQLKDDELQLEKKKKKKKK